uniref:Folliculin n=1 Tax=Trichobilharzia regenti TaxID=157069 RepID=A0AA85JP41_TRIRE|nr:unnamed protein product [Trichobilharzia regenti]
MDAVVALCHFCEQHGPSVVMCTQPFRQTQQSKLSVISSQSGGGGAVFTDPQSVDINSYQRNLPNLMFQNHTSGADTIPTGSSDVSAIILPSSTSRFSVTAAPSGSMSSHSSSLQQQQSSQHPTCKACSSVMLRDEPGIISHDQAANTSYISTQFIKDADLNTYVRNACLRSLSCEVCPGQVGVFYFGDETNGHVFSYNFSLNDSRARGNQSRYSILIVSWNKIYLLNLWSFLISNISRMVSRLRLSANKVFNDEISNNAVVTSTGTNQCRTSTATTTSATTAPLRRCATPPAALAPVLYGQAIAAGNAVAATNSNFYPHHHSTLGRETRQKRATDSDMRSLADLTKDDQIFYRIHAWFTWLLRAGGRRWSVLPSVIAPPEDEDTLIMQEEHEALLTAGVDHLMSSMNLSNPVISNTITPSISSANNAPNAANINNINSSSNNNISVTTASSCKQSMSHSSSSTLLFKPSISPDNSSSNLVEDITTLDFSCLSSEMENSISLLILSRLYHVLGVIPFSRLVQHIAIGNQIVVQPLDEDINATLTLSALAKLLPRGCIRQVLANHEYLPPFRCNLLSLSLHTASCTSSSTGYNDGQEGGDMPSTTTTANEHVLYLAVYRYRYGCHNSSSITSSGGGQSENDEQLYRTQCYVDSLYFRLSPTLPSLDPEIVSFKQTLLSQLKPGMNKTVSLDIVNLPSVIPSGIGAVVSVGGGGGGWWWTFPSVKLC